MNLEYDIPKLLAAVDRFPEIKVLVIGDLMVDEFIWGSVTRISPEAPVPVVDVTSESTLLGGAANVVNNVVSVGGRAFLAGVVGDDRAGQDIAAMLEDLGLETTGIFVDPDRPTTIKTRVVAHAQQVVRVDRENRQPLKPEVTARFLELLPRVAGEVDAVIISDYGKGLVSAALMDRVRQVFGAPGRIIAVDPKIKNFHLYHSVSLITPNHHEAAQGSGVVIDSEASLVEAGWRIMADLRAESVLITRGEQGMTLFETDREPSHIPTVAREVFDVTGAGDTVIALMILGWAAGLTRLEAAILANFAAGVVVGQVGTSTVTAEGLKAVVSRGFQGLKPAAAGRRPRGRRPQAGQRPF